MNPRRLRWHGAKRQQALADWLRLELGTWLEGWSVDSALLSLRLADQGASCPVDWRWLRVQSKNGSIVLGGDAGQLAGLGGLLAQASKDDPLGMGRRIGERALRALLAQFIGGTVHNVEFQDVGAPTTADLDPRFGGCMLTLQGPGFEARLLVDNACFEFWVLPQRAALPTLSLRDPAIGRESVTLDVLLDLGAATLADAQQLQVGDVLVSNASIDSLFHLALPDSRRMVAANLVRNGEQRALQIDTTLPRKAS